MWRIWTSSRFRRTCRGGYAVGFSSPGPGFTAPWWGAAPSETPRGELTARVRRPSASRRRVLTAPGAVNWCVTLVRLRGAVKSHGHGGRNTGFSCEQDRRCGQLVRPSGAVNWCGQLVRSRALQGDQLVEGRYAPAPKFLSGSALGGFGLGAVCADVCARVPVRRGWLWPAVGR